MTERVVNLRGFARSGGPRGPIVLPEDVVRVDRGTPWGNPLRIGETIDGVLVDPAAAGQAYLVDRELAVLLFHGHAERILARDPDWLAPLAGRRLACWCAPMLCHADVLVELEASNRPSGSPPVTRPPIVVDGWPAQLTLGVDRVSPAMAESPAWPRLDR